VEFSFDHHLNSMEKLLLLSLLFLVKSLYAQDTLYHPIPMLGHEKYILHDDGTFIYRSHQCGFTSLSFGSYRKNVFGYTFDYDTTKCPKPAIHGIKKGFPSDSIMLFFNDIVYEKRLYYFGSVSIGDQTFECQSDSLLIPKKLIKSNSLILKGEYSENITFTFDSTSTQLNLYLNLIAYECGINDIRKLKKTKHGYLNKFIVYDENNEKSWKKGKKRIVREYYQLRK